jgi:hypothetical protein
MTNENLIRSPGPDEGLGLSRVSRRLSGVLSGYSALAQDAVLEFPTFAMIVQTIAAARQQLRSAPLGS